MGATRRATCTGRPWRSASAGATTTRSWRRSATAPARWPRAPADVHVMFNNNRDDDAPTAARRFRALLGQEPRRREDQLSLGDTALSLEVTSRTQLTAETHEELALGALALCASAARRPAHAADPERDSFQADEGAPAEVPADVSRGARRPQGRARRPGSAQRGQLDRRRALPGQAERLPDERAERRPGRRLLVTTSATRPTPSGWSPPTWATCAWPAARARAGSEPRVHAERGRHPDRGLLAPGPPRRRRAPAGDQRRPRARAGARHAPSPRCRGRRRPRRRPGRRDHLRRPTRRHLVAYTAGDELRLAWRVMVRASSTARFDTLVDASSGEVVRRTNLVKFGTGLLFDNYPGAPVGGTAATKDLTPYVYPGANRLIGPNAHAFVDPEDVVPGPTSTIRSPTRSRATRRRPPRRTTSSTRSASSPRRTTTAGRRSAAAGIPRRAGSWSSDGDQAATQLFWFVNRYHDHLRPRPASTSAPSRETSRPHGSPAPTTW